MPIVVSRHPNHRGPVVEQQISGENKNVVGDVDDRVAASVWAGPSWIRLDQTVADREIQTAAEGLGRGTHGYVSHVEGPEGHLDEFADVRSELGLLDRV